MPNRYGDRISAIGITVIENGSIVKRFYSLVNPECRFDSFTIGLTGITPAMVADKPTFPEIWERIKDIMTGSILVAHSAQSDLHVLSRCLSSYEIEWTPTVKCLCTLTMGNICYPDMENHRLDTMCGELSIELDHHNASSDSDGAALLLLDYIAHGMDPREHIKIYDTVKAKMAHTPKKPFPMQVEKELRETLLSLGDERQKAVKMSYMSGVDEEHIIGVQKSEIRKYAQSLAGSAKVTEFVRLLPHVYQEENALHAYFLNGKRKYTSALDLAENFLPYIDCCETCDILYPKAFQRHSAEFLQEINLWLISYRSYTVRFAINMLVKNFLSEGFTPDILEMVYSVRDRSQPVRTALPVFYAAAAEKQYEAVLPYLEEHRLDTDIHNKTINKCLANKNIPKNRKLRLRELLV